MPPWTGKTAVSLWLRHNVLPWVVPTQTVSMLLCSAASRYHVLFAGQTTPASRGHIIIIIIILLLLLFRPNIIINLEITVMLLQGNAAGALYRKQRQISALTAVQWVNMASASPNKSSSSRMHGMNHNWSATKQRLHTAECSRDKPPFSFVRGQDSTMWDIVWVSPQGHRSVSVSRHFLLQAPCKNGSAETTVDEKGRNVVAGLWRDTENWPPEPTSSYASIDFWCQLVANIAH